jgi:hypothetical protein
MNMGTLVLGYHGCDRSFGERLLSGEASFRKSKNVYDWLGDGIYFWENNPKRALEWAQEPHNKKKIKEPFAVGAVIDLGNCLDLTESASIALVKEAHKGFCEACDEARLELPKNRKVHESDEDFLLRPLDCAVINYIHAKRDSEKSLPFNSVRGLFREGNPIYQTSGFWQKTHIQLSIRDNASIRGIFRIPENDLNI